MKRREFLKTSGLGLAGLPFLKLSASAAGAPPAPSAGSGTRHIGKAQPFSYAWLKGHARTLAGAAWRPPEERLPDSVKALDWDRYQAIGYRDDHALWSGTDAKFRVKFFHLGLFTHHAVHLYDLRDGVAQEIAYDPAMFDYGKSGLDGAALPPDLGFAGFRLNFHTDWQRDVAAFLGASYFRAVGAEMQYGLSARGLAIDCGMDRPEEFPRFTSFWFEPPAGDSGKVTVYALLDSPSVTGAYRFDITPGGTLVMDLDAALYPRKEIERIGIAPLTSMYQCGSNDRRMANDWRPQIHDSDGLALWTGAGEWIWRPLTNPATLRFNAYADENPRGFGLLQRDRNFDHYQDDGVFYDRRPSLWVEPRGEWGKGSVQLVEIPTEDETFDNIVAFWNPATPPKAGEELLFGYRLHWGTVMPVSSPLATVVQTRTGIGGVVGRKRTYESWRFVIDFTGGSLPMLGKDVRVEPAITTSHGEIEITSARPLASINGYRAMFDLKSIENVGEPVNLRLYLHADGLPLSETWLYQWSRPA
ncbi:periplasmic glucans biosynthesis protein [Opitutaceae bacterium TAV1]|nr:periplasmic glucans biosynthesis protein [Opitutaceae bacterium TAV1]